MVSEDWHILSVSGRLRSTTKVNRGLIEFSSVSPGAVDGNPRILAREFLQARYRRIFDIDVQLLLRGTRRRRDFVDG